MHRVSDTHQKPSPPPLHIHPPRNGGRRDMHATSGFIESRTITRRRLQLGFRLRHRDEADLRGGELVTLMMT
jgi:hypothetical protein